jgi:hypothetical protein
MEMMKLIVVSREEYFFFLLIDYKFIFLAYVIPCKEYECPISKLCIPKTWICDGTVDCGHEDSSDESGDCSKFQN